MTIVMMHPIACGQEQRNDDVCLVVMAYFLDAMDVKFSLHVVAVDAAIATPAKALLR
ncbi:hypothetical protein [uncultured Azohydromonas sp.]|uniref:hypothetical protein n=1 Tax=uncultured Azohydromonas sp. TaxID=487342 RepID=UPI0026036164|nr:hypothetical protein [uncultured Azohydromonas sp.]